MRIDVTKKRLDTLADPRDIEAANEQNEWLQRLEELSKLKVEKEAKPNPPKKMQRQRVSALQQKAVRR